VGVDQDQEIFVDFDVFERRRTRPEAQFLALKQVLWELISSHIIFSHFPLKNKTTQPQQPHCKSKRDWALK